MKENTNTPAISVVMPVHIEVNVEHLREALDSVSKMQLLKPREIVVVLDGPVSAEVRQLLCRYERENEVQVRLVPIGSHVGLGRALARGVEESRSELVARMDADDISLPERFRQESNTLLTGGYDVVGSSMLEFDETRRRVLHLKEAPETHAEIRKYARSRNPLNHPTVLFRRDSVLGCGNYRPHEGFEDYLLWVRMLLAGKKICNLRQPLLLYRIDAKMLARRGGVRYLANELRFQRRLFRMGFIRTHEFCANVAVRSLVRLLPHGARRAFYNKFLRAAPGKGRSPGQW